MLPASARFSDGTADKRQLLAARTATVIPDGDFVQLMTPRAADPAWRVIEAHSVDDLPFDLRINTDNAGFMLTRPIRVSSSRAVRVAVYTARMVVYVANRANLANTVAVNVLDSEHPFPTQNTWDYENEYAATPIDVEIPVFARSVWFDCEAANHVGSLIQLGNGMAQPIAEYTWSTQPPAGIPLGASRRIRVTLPAAGWFRLSFSLHV